MKPPSIIQVVTRITAIVASVELLIMLLLTNVTYELKPFTEALLDTVLLVALSSPMIFIWVIKPYVVAWNEALSQITYMAFHDPLTKLANRRLLSEYLERTVASFNRHKIHGAILLLDLDDFKVVNDTKGHEAGDAVLIEISRRINLIKRVDDVACRLGGDEFIVLLPQLDINKQTAHTKALQFAKRLQQELNKPIEFKGSKLLVGVSIGLRLLGSSQLDARTAISDADTAMYRAKQKGKGFIIDFEE
ncbi:MAG: GGDEF domain-containing protein [Porticoccus sp.]